MYPNLNAEMARHGHTNQYVGEQLGISRQSFETRKRSGTFDVGEIKLLLGLYDVEFYYLFATDLQESA